jgi:hypothetical protein
MKENELTERSADQCCGSVSGKIIPDPNTLTRREYKGKIYVKNIIKNFVKSETGSGYGSETNLKIGYESGTNPKKIIPDPYHWFRSRRAPNCIRVLHICLGL